MRDVNNASSQIPQAASVLGVARWSRLGQKRSLDWRSAMNVLLRSGEEDWGSNGRWEFSASGWLVERLRRAYLQR